MPSNQPDSIRRLVIVSLLAGLALVIIVGGLALAGVLPPGGTFTDDDGNVHEGNIEAIAAAGITKGCNPPANDLYCPGSAVTRGQMAAFLVRAVGLVDRLDDPFIDDDDSIFEADIEKLAAAGITRGCNPPVNDRYCPTTKVFRDQMASFLGRALGLDPMDPPPPTSTTTTEAPTTTTTTEPPNCHASYPDFCIPPPPPDLNCPDIPQKNFTVLPPDPHRFDGDKDGVGCET